MQSDQPAADLNLELPIDNMDLDTPLGRWIIRVTNGRLAKDDKMMQFTVLLEGPLPYSVEVQISRGSIRRRDGFVDDILARLREWLMHVDENRESILFIK